MRRHAWIIVVAPLASLAVPHGAVAGGSAQSKRDRLQTVDTASLAQTQTIDAIPTSSAPAAAMLIEAHAQLLRPAPLPDQDLDAPGPDAQALAEQQTASLQPSFYGQAKHFSGDGFAPGSTLDEERANRQRPGGGMSLSIPMP